MVRQARIKFGVGMRVVLPKCIGLDLSPKVIRYFVGRKLGADVFPEVKIGFRF